MTQRRVYKYKSPNTSKLHNERLKGLLPIGIYSGFNITPDGFYISISRGILLTSEYVKIEETADLTDILLLDGPDSSPRIDIVAIKHQHTVPSSPATYVIVKGTPAENPNEPSLPDAYHLALAGIRIDPDDTEIDPTKIYLKSRVGRFRHSHVYGIELLRDPVDPLKYTFDSDKLYIFSTTQIFINGIYYPSLYYTELDGRSIKFDSGVPVQSDDEVFGHFEYLL